MIQLSCNIVMRWDLIWVSHDTLWTSLKITSSKILEILFAWPATHPREGVGQCWLAYFVSNSCILWHKCEFCFHSALFSEMHYIFPSIALNSTIAMEIHLRCIEGSYQKIFHKLWHFWEDTRLCTWGHQLVGRYAAAGGSAAISIKPVKLHKEGLIDDPRKLTT